MEEKPTHVALYHKEIDDCHSFWFHLGKGQKFPETILETRTRVGIFELPRSLVRELRGIQHPKLPYQIGGIIYQPKDEKNETYETFHYEPKTKVGGRHTPYPPKGFLSGLGLFLESLSTDFLIENKLATNITQEEPANDARKGQLNKIGIKFNTPTPVVDWSSALKDGVAVKTLHFLHPKSLIARLKIKYRILKNAKTKK